MAAGDTISDWLGALGDHVDGREFTQQERDDLLDALELRLASAVAGGWTLDQALGADAGLISRRYRKVLYRTMIALWARLTPQEQADTLAWLDTAAFSALGPSVKYWPNRRGDLTPAAQALYDAKSDADARLLGKGLAEVYPHELDGNGDPDTARSDAAVARIELEAVGGGG